MNRIIIIILIIMLSDCSFSGTRSLRHNYYRFPESTIQPISNLNIKVKRASALGIFGNRPLVVQTNDGVLVQMNNNFWLYSPQRLLQNYLSEVFGTNGDKETLTLNSQIFGLEKKQQEALLSIKFTLTNNEGEIIFDYIYKNQKHSGDNSIVAFTKSIATLLEEVVEQFSKEIQ